MRSNGFTLLEMAVTLMIVSILLGGLLLTLGAQQDVARERETRKLMTDAKEALYGYVMANGRLPCPAAIGPGSDGEEINSTATGCQGGTQWGVLPWVTLGLPEGDSWAHRFRYAVSPTFSRSWLPSSPPYAVNTFNCVADPATAPTKAAFALCSRGAISVRGTNAGAPLVLAPTSPTDINSGAVAIIVSHGSNGAGARMVGGRAVGLTAAGDELENTDNDFDFVDGNREESYDDLVEWIPSAILMQRMVQAGRLP